MTWTIVDGAKTIDLGHIQQEGGTGDSGTTVVPSSTGASTESEAVKLVNAQQQITIQGVKVGNLASFNTFITDMQAARGDTTSDYVVKKVKFNSDLSGTNQNVVILTFDYDYIAGSVSKLIYTCKMQVVAP